VTLYCAEAKGSKASADVAGEISSNQRRPVKKTKTRNPLGDTQSADAAATHQEESIDQPPARKRKKKKPAKQSLNTEKSKESSGEIFVVSGIVQEEITDVFDMGTV
jgi:hypothetical protein